MHSETHIKGNSIERFFNVSHKTACEWKKGWLNPRQRHPGRRSQSPEAAPQDRRLRRPSPQRLDGWQILIFPDVDAYDYWKEKLSEHPRLQCYISDYLQRIATPDHPSADIADYLVEYKSLPCHPERSEGSSVMPGSTGHLPVSPPTPCPEPPIHPIQHILNQPEVAALIADLDLQLTSITKLNN